MEIPDIHLTAADVLAIINDLGETPRRYGQTTENLIKLRVQEAQQKQQQEQQQKDKPK